MATRDFRSQQIRTTQIIASGSDTTSVPSLLIYSASSATNDQGAYQASMLSSAGSDNWLFISGSKTNSDNQKVLFGGNITVSGTINGSTFGSMPGDSTSFNADEDLALQNSSVTWLLLDDSDNAVVINPSGSSDNVDVDFIVKTSNGAEAMSSAIHVNSNQNLVVLGRRDDPADLSASSTPPVGSDVRVFIDGTANSKDGASRGSTLVAGDLVVSGTLYAERQVMEVDLSQTGNLVMTGAVHFDDLGAAPGDSGQTTIPVPTNDGALFVATGSLRFRTTTDGSNFVETNVGAQYVAGNGIEESTAGSTTTFVTDDTIVAHLTGSEFSGPVGVTGSFGVDGDISLEAQDYLYLNGKGGDVFLRADTDNSIIIDGDDTVQIQSDNSTTVYAGSSNIFSITSTNGTHANSNQSDVDFIVSTNESWGAVLIDGADDSVIIGAETFDSNPNASELLNKGYGQDIKILLSGSSGSKDGATRGVVSVPGDMVVSGTLYYADDSSSESYLSSPGNGLSRDTNSNNRTIELSLNDVSGSAAIASGDTIVFIDSDDNSSTKKGTVSSLAAAIAGDGLEQGGNQLNVNVDSTTIEISGDSLRVANAGITATQIATSVAGNGLAGGGGSALSVNTGNGLKISSDNVITDDAVVAHLSGSEFNGHVGITGSFGVTGNVSLEQNQTIYFNGLDGDVFISGDNSSLDIDGDNTVNIIADTNAITEVGTNKVQVGLVETTFNVDGENHNFMINTSQSTAAFFIDSGDDSIIIGAETLIGASPNALDLSNKGYGSDVKTMLSGSAGSKDGATRGVVLVPGDMVISGTLYDGDGERISLLSIAENGTFTSAPSATGTNSVAIGAGATASQATAGHSIVAGGLSNTASGDYSATLGGQSNTAAGDWSVAMGRSNNVTGDDSVAIGKSLTVPESNTIAIGNNSNNAQVVVSGTLEAKSNVDFDADTAVSGSLFVSEYIKHIGDEDTAVHFLNDKIRLQVGTKKAVKVNTDSVLILSGGNSTSVDQTEGLDVSFFVSGSSNSKGTSVRGTSLFGGDVHISGALSGLSEYTLTDSTVRIFRDGSTMKFVDGITTTKTLEDLASVAASVDHFIGAHGADASLSKLKTTASIAFSGDEDAFVDGMASDGVGSDVFFFVSGTLGSKDGATRHASLFGGDVVISGSTHLADLTSSYIKTTGELSVGGNVIKNSNNDTNIRLSSSDNKVFIGSQYDTAPQALLDIRKDDNTGITSGVDGNTFANFNIALRNHSTANNAFAGIAFDVADEQDTDRIGASIAGVRTTTDSDNHQTDLRFYTNVGNDGGGVDDGLTERLRIKSDGKIGVGTDPSTTFHISGQDSLVVPVGTTAQRGTNTQGGIRYNTTLTAFEGYNGTSWASLGGVKDVDGDTYISAETTSGADNDDLAFFTGGTQRMSIDNLGVTAITGSFQTSADATIGGDLTVSGDDIKDSGGNVVLSFDGSGNVDNQVEFTGNGHPSTNPGDIKLESGLASIDQITSGLFFTGTGRNIAHRAVGAEFLTMYNPVTGQNELVVNDSGSDHDFRVETDTNTHTLFVRGSDNNVGIRNSSPSYPLDVTGDIRLSGDLRLTGNDIIGTALKLDSSGDITLSADGDQIRMDDGTTTRFTFNVDSTPELDVTGNFIIDGSGTIELDAVGNIELDSGGDITLDADGSQIYFKDAGTTRFTFNLDASPEIDVAGAFTLDCSSNITLDADGGTITFADNGVSLGTITSAGYSGNAASADTIDTTATSTDSDHYLTFVDSSSSTSGETLRVDSGIIYNPSSNNLTVNGHLEVVNGIKKSTSTKVAGYSASTNQWVKIASATDIDYDDSLNTVFLIILSGYEISTSVDGDATFEVNVKFNGDNASPYYNEEGTYITVDATNADNLNGFDPTTDIAITFDNTSTPTQVDLYIKSIENYKDAFVSIIGGTNVNGNTVDPGFELLTGQSFAASITSLGQEVYGTWASKVFNSLTAESASLPGSTIGITVSNPSTNGLYSVTTTEDYISDTSPSTGKARVTFVAPASGNVEINYQSGLLIQDNNAATLYLGLSTHATTFSSGDVAGTQNVVYDADTNRSGARVTIHHKWILTGLTAGTSYTYYVGADASNSTTFDIVWGDNDNDLYYPPLIVEARALPSITTM